MYRRAGCGPCVCQVNSIDSVCLQAGPSRDPMLVYLEARVGYEPGVITQVGGIVLHHALCLWLAEVLVGRGETTSCQHHSGGLWERDR